MFVIAVLRGTIAVPGSPVARAIIESVLIAVLPRCIRAVTTIAAAAISAAITIAIVVPVPIAAIAVVAVAFADVALAPAVVVRIKAAVVPRVRLALVVARLQGLPVMLVAPQSPSPPHWNHR